MQTIDCHRSIWFPSKVLFDILYEFMTVAPRNVFLPTPLTREAHQVFPRF
jgi:hypothetical protein